MKQLIFIFVLLNYWSLAQAKTTEFTFDNGLKLLVVEDHRAPVVVSQVWYKIGATYENGGIAGISHVLEHMMFKGTKNLKPGEFSAIIAENGGRENAFTSKDYTAYFQTISSDRLELCLRLEADRMRNLLFDEKQFKKELGVVKEERRWRVDNKPKSKLYEQFLATAFLNSPDRIPTIGWMTVLDQLSLDEVKDWYRRWYAPNNATIVIVGDVDPQNAYQLVKKYFSSYKAEHIESPKKQVEITQQGKREIILKEKVSSPYIMMGYKVPVMNTAKDPKTPYVLDVIGGILDGGSSARLAKNLLRGKEIAIQAGISYDLYDRLEGLFVLAGTPTPKHTIKQLQSAFKSELEKLKTTKVDQKELDRVIAQVVASKIYDRDSMFNMGMQIGILESVGGSWHDLEAYEKQVRKVTVDDIQRVAKQYFVDDGLTVAKLLPKQVKEVK